MKHLKKVDLLEAFENIIVYIVESKEDLTPFDLIGNMVMVDEEPHTCVGIERYDFDVNNETTIWAGEKFRLFGVYNSIEDEGDDWW